MPATTTSNAAYIELLKKPACTLTALEQYMVTKYCDEHPDEVQEMFAADHPKTTPLTLAIETPVYAPTEGSRKKFVYGIKGIAEIFHCGMTAATKIKNSGVINAAISQCGRKIVVDVEKAMALTSNDPKLRKSGWRA